MHFAVGKEETNQKSYKINKTKESCKPLNSPDDSFYLRFCPLIQDLLLLRLRDLTGERDRLLLLLAADRLRDLDADRDPRERDLDLRLRAGE